MKIKDIKLMVDNGGCMITKKHMDVLFNHIAMTNEGLKRIAKMSKLNQKLHNDFNTIHAIAETFIIEEK